MTDAEFAAAKSVLIGNEHAARHADESNQALADVLKRIPEAMTPEPVQARIAFELAAQESAGTP